MKTLLILRHAKSSWANTSLSDFERPLNARGKRDAPRIGRLLRQEALVPELIITSAAERAYTTAEAVALASLYDNTIHPTRALYHADPEEYLAALNKLGEPYQRVMVVGHNPGIEELVEEITGEWQRMPTAALAWVELPISDWSELHAGSTGVLRMVWRPRELQD